MSARASASALGRRRWRSSPLVLFVLYERLLGTAGGGRAPLGEATAFATSSSDRRCSACFWSRRSCVRARAIARRSAVAAARCSRSLLRIAFLGAPRAFRSLGSCAPTTRTVLHRLARRRERLGVRPGARRREADDRGVRRAEGTRGRAAARDVRASDRGCVELEQGGKLAMPASLRHAPARPGSRARARTSRPRSQLAYGLFPPGYLKRAVLVSDGVETEGDLLAEARRARALGVRLWAVPYRRPLPPEVAVVALRLPDKVDVGQSFEVPADVYASRATKVRAKLYQGEALNGLDGVREVELKPGPNEIKFQSVVRVGGEVTYELKLDAARRRRVRGEQRLLGDARRSGAARGALRRGPAAARELLRERARGAAVRRRRAHAGGVSGVAPRARALRLHRDLRRAARKRSIPPRRTSSKSTCAISAAASCSPAARPASASAAGRTRRSSGCCPCAWTPSAARKCPTSRWCSSSIARAR